jgi:Arc/MetJ family transcription regulator
MRTTLDLDEELLEAAARATGAPTKTALIELGLRALIEQAARRRLAERRGTIPKAGAPRRRRPSM